MKTGLTGFLFGERKGRDDGMKTGLTGFLFGERKGRDDGMKTRLTGFLVWGKKKRKKKEGRRRWVEIGSGFRLSFSCLLLFSGLSYPIKHPVNPAQS